MKCPICQQVGQPHLKMPQSGQFVLHRLFGVRMRECPSCKFVYADFIHPQVFDIFYRNFCRGEMEGDRLTHYVEMADRGIESQMHFILPHLTGAVENALDYGGGIGAMAKKLLEIAGTVWVTELDPNANKFIEHGDRIRLLSDQDLDGDAHVGKFDLIILSNVLEHMPDPVRQLARFSRMCKKDGLFFIEIPNEEQFIRATGLFCQQHVCFFSPATIKRAVEVQNSFDLVEFNLSGPRTEEIIENCELVHRPEAHETENGWVMRLLLRNARPVTQVPQIAMDMADVDEILQVLGASAMGLVNR